LGKDRRHQELPAFLRTKPNRIAFADKNISNGKRDKTTSLAIGGTWNIRSPGFGQLDVRFKSQIEIGFATSHTDTLVFAPGAPDREATAIGDPVSGQLI